jgi:hypothetical protein
VVDAIVMASAAARGVVYTSELTIWPGFAPIFARFAS